MNLLSWILLLAVIIGLGFAIRHILKNKGGCSCGSGSCSGSCSGCKGCGRSGKDS